MSKAFTREPDGDESDSLDESPDAGLAALAGAPNYITAQGAHRLKAELDQLLNVDRPTVVQTVSWAASNGDRSENGDYIYGKKRLREIDRRIRFLSKRLESAQIVDAAHPADPSRVLFGARVRLEFEDGESKKIQIVGVDETDVPAGRISWRSPLGHALLQAKVGDSVVFRTPKGEQEVTVLEIQYS